MKKLIQVYNLDSQQLGIYKVPAELSDEEFNAEFIKYEDQNDFDDMNTIEAERVFIEEEVYVGS
jgi:hypothetical protein